MAKNTPSVGEAARVSELTKLIEINERILRDSSVLTAKQKQIALAGVGRYRNALQPPVTSRSLDQTESDLLLAWNESAGVDTNAFWKQVKEAELPYRRRDGLREILERGKVRNRVEYDLLADTVEERAQAGSITDDERSRLRAMMDQYEAKHG